MTTTIDAATATPGSESPTRSDRSSPTAAESTTVGRATVLPAPRLPSWFAAGLIGAVVWCATAGATGVVLLTTGGYHPVVVGGVATLAALAAAIATTRALGRRTDADHRAGMARSVSSSCSSRWREHSTPSICSPTAIPRCTSPPGVRSPGLTS